MTIQQYHTTASVRGYASLCWHQMMMLGISLYLCEQQNDTPVLQLPPEQGSWGLAHLQQTASAHSQELLHLTLIAAQTLSECIKTWSDSDYSLSLTFNSWDTASKNESSEETFIPSFCFNSLLHLKLAITISTHGEKSEVTHQSRFSVFFPRQIQGHTLQLDALCAPNKLCIRIESSRGSHSSFPSNWNAVNS